MTNQLAFHNTVIQYVNYNHQIWISSSDLTPLLEYKNDDSITKIYNCYSYELTNKMTQRGKLSVSGNYKKQCGFSFFVVRI